MDIKEYNKLLKFLYFEGYSDSYEEAEQLIEQVDDDEFETLYEEFLLTEAVDIVSDYLISEGFASDEQSAMAMFTAMSDDWLQQIVEEMTGPERGAKILAAFRRGASPQQRAQMIRSIAPGGPNSMLSPEHPVQKAAQQQRQRRRGIQSVQYK